MFKNISPRSMALFGAFALTSFVLLGIWIGDTILQMQFQWKEVLLLILCSGIFSFFIIHFILQQFIYRRIKLIYKIIRKAKTSVP